MQRAAHERLATYRGARFPRRAINASIKVPKTSVARHFNLADPRAYLRARFALFAAC